MHSTCLRRLPLVLLLGLVTFDIAAAPPSLAQPAGIERWTPIGPDGGVVRSLAADPGAPGVLYAGTEGGGVWRSLDGGRSWATTPEGLGAAPVLSLAASAGRVYAGNYYSMHVLGDGAAAWRQVGPFPFGPQAFAIDPGHPEQVWAAGENRGDGVLFSDDGGEQWRPKLRLTDPFRTLAIAPTVPPTVYAAGHEGIFASTDTGINWRQLNPRMNPADSAGEIEVDPEDAQTLYVTSFLALWKTTDGGASWSRHPAGAQTSHLLALPGVLLGVNGDGLRRSEDGGATWGFTSLPWWDVFSLVADPASPAGAWLSVRGGGLMHTSDGGRTWVRRHGRGLRASSIQAFAFDPFRPRTLYASTVEYSPAFSPVFRMQRSVDAGASWTKPPTLLNVRALTADPRRPGTLVAGTPHGVSVSRDRGTHWQRVLTTRENVDSVLFDPRRPETIWAGGYGLWRSQDAGRTWERRPNPPDALVSSAARRIYLSPWTPESHPETLYLIDFYLDGLDVPGTLWRSADGGSTWEAIDQEYPVALAFDSTAPGLLYVADVFGDIRRSPDGGTTWETVASSVGGGDRLTSLLLDPLDPSVLYVGTAGNGVWRSRDQGVTWQPLSAGMIGPVITCLEADPREPRHLVACTQGGGLLEIRTSEP
jgi:photosystem II stability/assembly factor-like uncharacterized protein